VNPTVRLALLLVLWALLPAWADVQPLKQEGVRRALVIGVGGYKDAPLKNPLNDAQGMARALGAQGFVVSEATNLTRTTMLARVEAFVRTIGKGDWVLFYFAGHGIQLNGRNLLMPVDAAMATEEDVQHSGVDVASLVSQFARAGARMNLVFLDACRNNPFGQAKGLGLAAMDAPRGTLIAFATAPGKSALDGVGSNGLYTKHLLSHLAAPGVKIEDVMKRVRAGVMEESRGSQIPWENTSLTEDFFFRAGDAQVLAGDARPTGPDPEHILARQSLASRSGGALLDYLSKYPAGAHRGEVEAAYAEGVAKAELGQLVRRMQVRDCASCPPLIELDAGPGQPDAVGAYPVTVREYEACVKDRGCPAREADEFGGGDRPAVNLSQEDAVQYTRWLSGKSARHYRLPTAPEWQHIAGMGQVLPTPQGPRRLPFSACLSANGYDRSAVAVAPFPWQELPCHDGFPYTSPVGMFQPNALGLFDMFGNVWQWTATCAKADEATGIRKGCIQAVLKGGSWASVATSLNEQAELLVEPNLRGNTFGFRVVRVAK
jgi:hypothetical protein